MFKHKRLSNDPNGFKVNRRSMQFQQCSKIGEAHIPRGDRLYEVYIHPEKPQFSLKTSAVHTQTVPTGSTVQKTGSQKMVQENNQENYRQLYGHLSWICPTKHLPHMFSPFPNATRASST